MPTIFELKYALHPDPMHTNCYASTSGRDPEERFPHKLWFKFWQVKADGELIELSEDATSELRQRIKEEHQALIERNRDFFTHSVKVVTSFREDDYPSEDRKRANEVDAFVDAYKAIVNERNWSFSRLAYKTIGYQLDIDDADNELSIPKELDVAQAYECV